MAKRTDNAADTSNITGEYFLSVQQTYHYPKDCFGRKYFVRKLVLWVWKSTPDFYMKWRKKCTSLMAYNMVYEQDSIFDRNEKSPNVS